MKRIFLLLTFALVAAGCSFSSKPKAPERQGGWDDEHPLYGDVDSVIIISYDLYQLFDINVPRCVENLMIFRFNDAGDVVESLEYRWLSNYHTSSSARETYEYDSDGNMTKRHRYGKTESDENFEPMSKFAYKKGKQNNSVEVTLLSYDPNDSSKYEESRSKEVSQYDNQGNLIERATYDLEGSLKWKYTYKYNAKGDMTEEAHYSSDGSLEYKYIHVYDERGYKIESYYTSDSTTEKTSSYTYDSNGNMIEEIEYRFNDFYLRHEYKYDSKGNRVEKVSYVNENSIPSAHTEYRIYYRK